MKVLMVNSRYAPYSSGGADISTRKLAIELHNKGVNVEILTCNEIDEDDYLDGIHIWRRRFNNIDSWYNYRKLSRIKKLVFKVTDYYNFLNYSEVEKILQDVSPDVIHTNNINGISPVIWKVARDLNIPVVHTCRDYYLLCEKTTLLNHTGTTCTSPRLICRAYRYFNKKYTKNIEAVTAPSKFALKLFIEDGFFKNSIQRPIYNAIDFNIEQSNKILNRRVASNRLPSTIIYLGALNKNKGVDVLLDAFSETKRTDLRLYIAGNGVMKESVIKKSEVDPRIRYLGFLQQEDLEKFLLESDLLVCPSVWNEPFGRVVIDAYKYAIPVIASKSGGLTEIVPETSGILVEAGNRMALLEAINLLTSDIVRYRELCGGAVNELKKYSIDSQCCQFVDLYNNVIGKEPRI